MINRLRNSILYCVIILSALLISISSNAKTSLTNGVILPFSKSDIFVMYNEKDLGLLKKYKVDHITWGNQVNIYPKEIRRFKKMLLQNRANGIKLNSIDIALMQEGGKYTICGDKWDIKCNRLYVGLRNKDKNVTANLNPELINKRAVLDLQGKRVAIPWLMTGDVTLPIASVNDPGYKKWLIHKIDGVLKIKPDAIHFDEPVMESVAINTRRPFGLTTHSLQEFNRYLKNTKEPGWKPDGIHGLDEFDYKKMILASSGKRKKTIPPLWKEFTEFKVSSSVKLFRELTVYAKERATWPLLVSANASPADWRKIPLIQYLDVIAPEVKHYARELEVPSSPLYLYKLAEALHKPIISTAFGTDWAVIKKGKHVMLACAWIAQAYAAGQYMNFPLKAWVPGAIYKPETNIYPQLAGWIKEKSVLFDGYETIAPHALIISTGMLRSNRDRKILAAFAKKLMEEGVLFKIILEQKEQKLSVAELQGYESVIIPMPKYFSEDTMAKLRTSHARSALWEPSRAEMQVGTPRPGLVQIQILDEEGIFCFPRRKFLASHDAVVLHLLNRDYLPDSKMMQSKGPFNVRVSKKMFNHTTITGAILHQPVLNSRSTDASVNISSTLTIKDEGEYMIITVPFLDLWGIVEFISS